MKSLSVPPTSPGFISLATKLAVGLCAVLLAVSSAVSVWLTEHEREDMLRAKQRSSETIADAYAISMAVPLENGSLEDTTELFTRIDR